MSQAVRLLHIPKTGGTSVASGLMRVYGHNHRFEFRSNPSEDRARFNSLDPARKAAVRAFIGHCLYDTGIPEADRIPIATILRDPVARVKSFIRHAAAGRSTHLADMANSGPFPVDEFLESGNPEIANLQTRILINSDRLESSSGLDQLGEDGAFDLAKERLFHGLAAFGLQERFDEGWVAVWLGLGHKPPLYAILNRRPDPERLEFTPAQTERIRELNRVDIRLYDAAKEEFNRRIQTGQIPAEEIHAFVSRQKRYGPAFTFIWGKVRKTYGTWRRMRNRLKG